MEPSVLEITTYNSPEEAPSYTQESHTPTVIHSAVIVKNGTVGGNATVDIISVDLEGNEYVAMITGALIEGLAAAIRGTRTN